MQLKKNSYFRYSTLSFQQILMMLISAVLIVNLFSYGQKLKMNSVIPSAVDDNTWAISVAISDNVYKLNRGYLYFPQVWRELSLNGMAGEGYTEFLDKIDKPYPENVRDPIMMNQALQKAINLKLDIKQKSLKEHQIKPLSYTEIGLVDYYKCAFIMGGYKVSSPYNFFFVLLSAIVICYLLAFYNQPLYAGFAILYLSLLFLIFKYIYDVGSIELETVFNFRAIPILAILPATHIMLFLSKRNFSSQIELFCFIFQSILVPYLISVRCSAAWIIIAFLLFLVFTYFPQIQSFNRDTFFKGCRENKGLLILLSIPILTQQFIKSYKGITILIAFGAGIIKKYSLTWFDISVWISQLAVLSVIGFAFFINYRRLKRDSFISITLQIIAILSISFIFPIWAYYLEQKSKLVLIPQFFQTGIKCISIGLLGYFIYSMYRGLQTRMSLDIKRYLSLLKNWGVFPLVLFFFIFFSYQAHLTLRLSPFFNLYDSIPHHLSYHNAYLGLVSSSTFEKKYTNGLSGDQLGYKAGLEMFKTCEAKKGKQVTIENYISSYTGSLKMKLHDLYIKKAYLQFIQKHPLIFIEAHWNKCLVFYWLWKLAIKKWCIWIALISLTLTGFFLYTQKKEKTLFQKAKILLQILSCIFIASMTPGLYAYPASHSVTDHMLSIIFMCIAISVLLQLWLVKLLTAFFKIKLQIEKI